MVRLAGRIVVPGGGEAAALRALLQEPEWSDQGCYGLGYVDGPLAGTRAADWRSVRPRVNSRSEIRRKTGPR